MPNITLNPNELFLKAVYGFLAILLVIVGFFGRDLYSQVQDNTAQVQAQAVKEARLSENVRHLSDNIEGLKRAIEQLINHEVDHRLRDR